MWIIQVFRSVLEMKAIAEIIIENRDYRENVSTEFCKYI